MRPLIPLCRLLALAGAALAAALPGRAIVAVSNIITDDNFLWNVDSLASYESFTVGNEAATLQGFSFRMTWGAGSAGHVDIHTSSGSSFGSLLASTGTYSTVAAGQGTIFIAAPSLTLEANTTYFIHVVREAGTLGTMVNNSSFTETGLPGWSIGDRSWLVNYNEWSTGIPMFAVETSAVPEPASAALALGAAGLGLVLYRRRRAGAGKR